MICVVVKTTRWHSGWFFISMSHNRHCGWYTLYMEEQIDVLDQNGNFTGIKKPKSEVHKSGDWHRTVHVWLLNSKNELLMQLRSPTKLNCPNLWDISSAGHISAGEDGKTSAIREMKEELGISITEKDLLSLEEIKTQDVLNNNTYFDNEFHDVFLIRKDVNVSNLILQKEEVADAKWINYFELEKDIQENPDKYVGHDEEYKMLFAYLKMLK